MKLKKKGILLAAGSGSRLLPASRSISKHLLPVYDKPMIYYPLSVLMLAGIRTIQIIVNARDLESFRTMLGNGAKFGIDISYKIQDEPKGIGHALQISKDFINSRGIFLILGDNIFYGQGFVEKLQKVIKSPRSSLFCYQVKNPEDFGVVELDHKNKILDIAEKPTEAMSNWVATGLYSFDENISEIVSEIKPSARNEIEITDVNKAYLNEDLLDAEFLGRGLAWLDAGSPNSLLEASLFVKTIEERQGLKIACLEEIAYANGWIEEQEIKTAIDFHKNSSYGEYLVSLFD